jgi:hypothetical protein
MSITAANALITLAVESVFPNAVQIQGFAADDLFDAEDMEIVETLMGVDGYLSAGYVNVPFNMNISLQADSLSNFLFDQWFAAQRAAQDVFAADGEIVLPSIGTSTILSNGYLVKYKPVADAKKLLQPRKYMIRFNSNQPIPL